MKKLIVILAALASAAIYADETKYANYDQDTTPLQFDLIWQYNVETSGGVTYAVITGVRDSGSAYPSGDIAVPVSVSATPSGTGYIVKKIADNAFKKNQATP